MFGRAVCMYIQQDRIVSCSQLFVYTRYSYSTIITHTKGGPFSELRTVGDRLMHNPLLPSPPSLPGPDTRPLAHMREIAQGNTLAPPPKNHKEIHGAPSIIIFKTKISGRISLDGLLSLRIRQSPLIFSSGMRFSNLANTSFLSSLIFVLKQLPVEGIIHAAGNALAGANISRTYPPSEVRLVQTAVCCGDIYLLDIKSSL